MIQLGLFFVGVQLAERLPGRLLYRVARFVGRALARIQTPAKRRLRNNLAHVIRVRPDSPLLQPYVRRIFEVQACNYVDLLRTRVTTSAEVAHNVSLEGPGWNAFRAAQDQNQGVVLVTAHFGRIELLGHALVNEGIRITLPVERLQPPSLFDLVCRLRTRPTVTLVPHDMALRHCLRALARGEVTVFFSDWDPTGHGVSVEFFGAPAALPAGPAFVALRANAPLFIGFGLPGDSPERVRLMLEDELETERTGELDHDIRTLTQAIASTFERYIRQHPDQWIMFHDIWRSGKAYTAPEQPALATMSR